MIKILKIKGNSLYPHLQEGQRVICIKNFKFLKLNINDYVVFEKQGYGLMIKQISAIENGSYFVRGTDFNSIDSRNFGIISRDEIKYKVLFKH